MKTKLHHFTSKMYLITYDKAAGGFGCREYGIVKVFNKRKEALNFLEALKEKTPEYRASKITYDFKEIDLDNPLTTKLFEFLY